MQVRTAEEGCAYSPLLWPLGPFTNCLVKAQTKRASPTTARETAVHAAWLHQINTSVSIRYRTGDCCARRVMPPSSAWKGLNPLPRGRLLCTRRKSARTMTRSQSATARETVVHPAEREMLVEHRLNPLPRGRLLCTDGYGRLLRPAESQSATARETVVHLFKGVKDYQVGLNPLPRGRLLCTS